MLRDYQSGNRDALDRLLPLVYMELRRIAGTYMRRQQPSHTLQPTALIHEAYLKLLGNQASYTDRTHFFASAAAIMRNLLVDHARARAAEKRGGGAVFVALDDANPTTARPTELVALDDALTALAKIDQRKAAILELRYFAGLRVEEMAEALGISVATVGREIRFAEAWLRKELLSAVSR